MATKIQQILDDQVLADKLTRNGYALLKTYSWQTMAKQTLAVFEAALRKN
jgi:glycosyltransferase involved in cell wall biosynthesis